MASVKKSESWNTYLFLLVEDWKNANTSPFPKGMCRSSLRYEPSGLRKRSGRNVSGSPQYSGSIWTLYMFTSTIVLAGILHPCNQDSKRLALEGIRNSRFESSVFFCINSRYHSQWLHTSVGMYIWIGKVEKPGESNRCVVTGVTVKGEGNYCLCACVDKKRTEMWGSVCF